MGRGGGGERRRRPPATHPGGNGGGGEAKDKGKGEGKEDARTSSSEIWERREEATGSRALVMDSEELGLMIAMLNLRSAEAMVDGFGCLSVSGIVQKVERWSNVVVNIKKKMFGGVAGLMPRQVQ